MPHTPLRELKPELFKNEYETDSEAGTEDLSSDSDSSSVDSDDESENEFNLDGLDIDDDVPNRG